MYGYLVLGIVLEKGRDETFVEVGLKAFAGPDDGDVGDVISRFGEDCSSSRDRAIVEKPSR